MVFMRRLFLLLFLGLLCSQVFAGVLYRVNGVIDIRENSVIFTTEDARIYQLEMSKNEAKKYDGQPVQIDAVSKDATKVTILKVKKVRPFEKKITIKDPKPYKNSQKAASLIKAGASEISLKNVRWSRSKKKDKEGQPLYHWRNVKIRPDLIDKAYFVVKPFPPEWIAAHCLMLFTFKKGGFVDEQGNESKGLVLSIEALQRTDQKYSLTDGMKNKFGAVWILATWEDYAAESCHFADYKLVPYEVKFNHLQNKRLLVETIKQSIVNRSGEFYHTTRNNCTNNLVILLDKIGKTKIKFWTIPSMIYNVRATMPVMVPKYLQKKGLLGKEYAPVTKKNFFADPAELFK